MPSFHWWSPRHAWNQPPKSYLKMVFLRARRQVGVDNMSWMTPTSIWPWTTCHDSPSSTPKYCCVDVLTLNKQLMLIDHNYSWPPDLRWVRQQGWPWGGGPEMEGLATFLTPAPTWAPRFLSMSFCIDQSWIADFFPRPGGPCTVGWQGTIWEGPRLHSAWQIGKSEGPTLLTGGKPAGDRRYYIHGAYHLRRCHGT